MSSYKVTKILNRDGSVSEERINAIKAICPSMTGTIMYPEYVKEGYCFCFSWDNSTKMTRTSTIQKVETYDDGQVIEITTRNRIYTLEAL